MNTLADPRPAFGHHAAAPVEDPLAPARSAGYAAGWSLGVQQARVQVLAEHEATVARLEQQTAAERHRLSQAIAALQRATAMVAAEQAPGLAEVSDLVLSSGVELAQAILGHELATSATPGLDALHRALRLSDGVPVTSVRLSPGDAATLAEIDVPSDVRVVADPGLAPGDSIAELAGGRVEIRLGEAMQRARDLLGG